MLAFTAIILLLLWILCGKLAWNIWRKKMLDAHTPRLATERAILNTVIQSRKSSFIIMGLFTLIIVLTTKD